MALSSFSRARALTLLARPVDHLQVREAKLETKNRAVILQACDELIALGKDAIEQHKNQLKGKKVAGETVRPIRRRPAPSCARRPRS